MNNDALIEQHIDAVDAFARTLFVRAKQIPSLSEVATAVKELHDALRHLRVEAADPDSLLNNALTPEASNFSRQLPNIVEDCEFALSQLERLLDDEDGAPESRATSLRRKLQNESDNINDFLDDVQLFSQSQASSTTLVSGREPGLDDIKDKLDNVARRIFTGRTNSSPSGDDGLWREFKTELEKEGFSKEVLHQHKDVLRAYIRELEALCPNDGDPPPTVRGLLEYESQSAMVASPSKELMHPDGDNEKFAPSMKNLRRMPDDAPVLPPRPNEITSTQYASSMEDDPSENGESMALISTKDLVAMDSLNAGMADMQLRPYGQAHPVGSPPLPSPAIGSPPRGHDGLIPANTASLDPPREVYELPGSPSTSLLGSSPQYAPLPTYSSINSPPPAYAQAHASQRAPMRLAPDRHGRDIGMGAQWTRIPRHLVSPEVLEKAGVRYEARPTYVAILGRLSREEVKEFARRSADCRAARSMRQSPPRKSATQSHERNDSRSSNEEDDDDSTLFDSGDSTDADDDKTSDKGTKGYPYIVSPPERERGSPSSTVQPKSILKNKNTNHVHFGRNPYEVESKSPRSLKDDRDRKEPPRRSRDHRSSETSHHRRDRDEDGARYRESRDRHDRERRRYDDRDRDRDRDHYSRRRHRDDRYYDDRRGRDQRRSKKKAWGETLGAVGVGGAAVSLLGVLAQAATGM